MSSLLRQAVSAAVENSASLQAFCSRSLGDESATGLPPFCLSLPCRFSNDASEMPLPSLRCPPCPQKARFFNSFRLTTHQPASIRLSLDARHLARPFASSRRHPRSRAGRPTCSSFRFLGEETKTQRVGPRSFCQEATELGLKPASVRAPDRCAACPAAGRRVSWTMVERVICSDMVSFLPSIGLFQGRTYPCFLPCACDLRSPMEGGWM